jgi:hypothetical protein
VSPICAVFDWCLGSRSNEVDVDPWGQFDKPEVITGHVQNGQFGDDPVYHCLSGQGQGAGGEQLGCSVSRGVFHGDDDAAGAVDKVHCAAHALDHLAGHGPVGEIPAVETCIAPSTARRAGRL